MLIVKAVIYFLIFYKMGKKFFLFSLFAFLAAWFWFGGISMAACEGTTQDDNEASLTVGNEIHYCSLTDAVNAVNEGNTIVLLRDVEWALTITEGKSFTLDLGWHNITSSDSDTISNHGTLTILNWAVKTTAKNKWAIVNYPWWKITIWDINKKEETLVNISSENNKYARYSIKNMWTMIVNSARITKASSSASIIDNGWYWNAGNDRNVDWPSGCSSSATLTFNWWTVEWPNWESLNVIKNDDCGVLVINNGTFTSNTNLSADTVAPVIMNWHIATVNWWTFQSAKWVAITNGYLGIEDEWEIEVNWGTFIPTQSLLWLNDWAKEWWKVVLKNWTFWWTITKPENKYDVQIQWGIFQNQPNANYIVEWYVAAANSDDTYTVLPAKTVAFDLDEWKIGDSTTYWPISVWEWRTVSKPADPTKDWYTFNNWYVGDIIYDFSSAVNDNIIIKAKWLMNHTISFNLDEWDWSIDNQTKKDWEKVIQPDNPSKNWYVFDKWMNGEAVFDFDKALASTDGANITLTATWTQNDSETIATIGDTNVTSADFWIVVDEDVKADSNTEDAEDFNKGKDTIIPAAQVQDNWYTATVLWWLELKVVQAWVEKENANVTFKKPFKLRIPVNTNGSVFVKAKHYWDAWYSFDGLVSWTPTSCEWATPYTWTPITVVGGYAEIYTCKASTFVAYTEVANSTPSSWGGGWGGSSSYSCKNLPDNATANNTTKPTKSTNYSYSTDTTKVCTFQCKSGYTWNSKDAKCEKSDANTNDENKVDETNNENNNNEWNNNGDNNNGWSNDGSSSTDKGFSQEFKDAYKFAHENGITTKDSIEEADMYGPLTRIAMAKMLSQYAINVLGKTPDTSKVVPNFPDVDAQLDADYNNWVTLAYQLGIMWIGIEEFRPFDLVTRAEFGTALSRMLYGTADGEGNEWYSTHLEKLMNEKIITNDNPQLKELRGYVMIMLMRSAQ